MAFDALAGTYDAGFGVSPTGRTFRFRLAERVMKMVPPPARVLDVGCGTGEDALWLAAQGYQVHGTDESLPMIESARQKAARVGSRATFQCRRFPIPPEAGEAFDAVVSNFGVLNCVPLEDWTTTLPRYLAPSGKGFVVLMGRNPLPEAVRGGFGGPRRDARAQVRVGAGSMTIRYDSVSAVQRALSSVVSLDRVEALGCLVPSPGYEGFARRNPITLSTLAMFETLVRSAPFFRGWGDHTLFEFRRR